jgi:hypothetical protein
VLLGRAFPRRRKVHPDGRVELHAGGLAAQWLRASICGDLSILAMKLAFPELADFNAYGESGKALLGVKIRKAVDSHAEI